MTTNLDKLQALIDHAKSTTEPTESSDMLIYFLAQPLKDLAVAADWIAIGDMDPEDHKAHRKYYRLKEKLDEIRKLIEAATPGPLQVQYSEQPHDEIIAEVAKMIAKGGDQWFWVSAPMIQIEGDSQPITVAETGNGPTSRANAQFIAASRELMPELVDEVDRLRKRNTRLEAVAEAASDLHARLENSDQSVGAWLNTVLGERLDALSKE